METLGTASHSGKDRPVGTHSDPSSPSADNHAAQHCTQVLRDNAIALRRIQTIVSPVVHDRGAAGADAAYPVSHPETRPWSSVSEGSHTGLDQFQQEWLQRLSALETRITRVEALVGNAAAEFEAATLTRLHQALGETIRQACERIKRYAVACKESRLIELEAEIERKMEPIINRSQMTISDLEQLLASIIRQQQDLRAHTSQARMHDYSQV